MQNDFSVAGHWDRGFDEAGLTAWAAELRRRLPAREVSLGLVFMNPSLAAEAESILEILRVHARIPILAGCSSGSLIAEAREMEDTPGLVLGLYHLPGAVLKAVQFTQEQVEESSGPAYWLQENGVLPDETNGWLTFADPFQLDCESWLRQWNEAYPGLPIVGGLAGGLPSEQSTQVYLNGEAFAEGGVGLSIGGAVTLHGVISQGCTPIGETWTITKVERNVIHEIGNRPAYEVLAETFASLPDRDQKQARGNLFVGLVVNEYLDEFHRGDFLIRNLIGADPKSGAIAIGALPRPGQTIQFQRRAAAAGTEDMVALLARAKAQIGKRAVYGGCLCSCNGRGSNMFNEPDHDARHVQAELGPMGLAGFFCNGEIGPIGEKNFLHGYTASLALLVNKS